MAAMVNEESRDTSMGEGEGKGKGLVGLATEMVHEVALSGWLGVGDVAALSQTCSRMANVLVWDGYAKDLHLALLGVMENVRKGRWRSAQYAVKRRWFVEEEEEETVWRKVALVAHKKRMKARLENESELAGWEDVMLAALSLPGASGCLEAWDFRVRHFVTKMSLLMVAAGVGSERISAWGVERGADSVGGLALVAACASGRVGIVRMLVEAGADVATGATAKTLLHAACRGGDTQVVEYLMGLGVCDVDEKDRMWQTPLHTACMYGGLDMVKLLVEGGGADVDAEDKEGRTALFKVCEGGGEEDLVCYLLEAGANAGIANASLATPLDVAQRGGHDRVAELLLEHRSRA